MNRESLLQTLRVHVMRLRQQHQRQHPHDVVACTVDELVCQVEGVLSTDKPDFGFGEALARLQVLMGGAPAVTTTNVSNTTVPTMPTGPIRRGSIGATGSFSEIIDAEALVSRHALKTML